MVTKRRLLHWLIGDNRTVLLLLLLLLLLYGLLVCISELRVQVLCHHVVQTSSHGKVV
jgi:hypothetical protein